MIFLWRIFFCMIAIAMISSGGWWMYFAAFPIAVLMGSLENGVIREMLTLERNNRVRQEELTKKISESRGKNV